MKKLHVLGVMAVSLALMTAVFGPVHEVMATRTVTAEIQQGIERVEEVLAKVNTEARTDLDAHCKYLQGLVAQAEKVLPNTENLSSDNAEELIAALDEGAKGLSLIAGLGKTEVEPQASAKTAEAPVQAPKAQVPQARVEAKTPAKQQAVAKQAKTRTKQAVAVEEMKTVAVLADVKSDTKAEVEVQTEQREVAQAEVDAEMSDAEVEEVVGSAKDMLRLTGIVMSVIVVLAAVGAVLAVKRIKRNI